jgi:hypothetical protein
MVRVIRPKTAYAALFACLAVAVSSQANAAEPAFISKVGGKGVTLSKGEETVPVRVQTLLSSGDRVTAAKGSSVEVTYLDGCTLKVANGKSITVSAVSPCAAAEATQPVTETQALEVASGEAEENIEPAATAGSVEVTDITGPLARGNLGEGLVDLNVGMVLEQGDTVFAGQSSTVTLYFVDPKCSYTLPPETFLEITDDPPCREEAAVPPEGNAAAAAAVGAAALGGGAIAVFLLTQDDDDDDRDRPATPN